MSVANENEPHGWEVGILQVFPGQWLIEAVDHGSEGEVYRAMFDGHNAKRRAENYALATFGSLADPPPITGTRRQSAVQRRKPVADISPTSPRSSISGPPIRNGAREQYSAATDTFYTATTSRPSKQTGGGGEIQMAAERLSAEAGMSSMSPEGSMLRAKMRAIAKDLFDALSTNEVAR